MEHIWDNIICENMENIWKTYGKHMGKIWENMNPWSTTPGRPQAAL